MRYGVFLNIQLKEKTSGYTVPKFKRKTGQCGKK